MSRPRSKQKQRSAAKAAAFKKKTGLQGHAEREAIRLDMKQQSGDPGFGTGSAALGLVKMASEEARHVTCPSCGFANGRHIRGCERA